MKVKRHIPLQRLIAKVDNDFNISESDWIPRVAAWTIDALAQMNVLPMERKRRELEVSERIAQFPCRLNTFDIKVYDKNGCEIANLSNSNCCNSGSGTKRTDSEIAVFDSSNKTGVNTMNVATVTSGNAGRNYVIQGDNIELNFNTDKIIVDSYETATYYDDYYDCEVPYIYDDGILLEAISWYILFKYLSRGSKHPVYNLTSNSPVTNPYIQWNTIRPRAIASVKNNMFHTDGWNNFFYNSTFNPRR